MFQKKLIPLDIVYKLKTNKTTRREEEPKQTPSKQVQVGSRISSDQLVLCFGQ